MREYSTKTSNTCWRDSIACLLEIRPSRVPNFVKLYGKGYMEETHRWLAEEFKKGLVYVPAKHFMETGDLKNNPAIGPSGYSIGLLSMVDDRTNHAVVCLNGVVVWDNGEDRSEEYGVMMGYYIIYDLTPEVGGNWKRKQQQQRKK